MTTISKEAKSIKKKPDSLLYKRFPKIFTELDFDKNKQLGLDVYSINYGSPKAICWICPKCKSKYDRSPNSRTGKESSCPYCSGHKVNSTNSLAARNPLLSKEWHPTKNGILTPNNIYFRGAKKYWWLCEQGHEWEAVMEKRQVRGDGCAICSHRKLLVGFNDMWTTNPAQASLLSDPDDGYKYTQASSMAVNWKCESCEEKEIFRKISDIYSDGLSCPNCSSSFSFGERYIYSLLNSISLDFDKEVTFSWSENKRYDFYVSDCNLIVEVHGGQHYKKRYTELSNIPLSEVQQNDQLKEELAIKNGIKNYVVLDVRVSTVKQIKESILNSPLVHLLKIDEETLDSIGYIEANTMYIKTWELWNSGYKEIEKIALMLKVSRATVRTYLKRGAELGKCDYTVDFSRSDSLRRRTENNSVAVVKLSLDGDYIETYSSLAEAARMNNLKTMTGISATCRGKRNKSGGFRWMYLKEYNEKIEVKLS